VSERERERERERGISVKVAGQGERCKDPRHKVARTVFNKGGYKSLINLRPSTAGFR
jgi:hypothetical protein